MIPTVTIGRGGVRDDVLVFDGVAVCDTQIVADVVNEAAARGDEVAVTATGPFRYGLVGDAVAVVEWVAGVLARAGFTIARTDPPRGTYPTPGGAVQ